MIYEIKNVENIKIIREIGSGGMGVVYEGFDEVLERKVAVKMMLPQVITPHGRKRFLKEAAIMAKINHPSTINIYSFGEVDVNGTKIPYFVMEYVEGKSLAEIIARLNILKNNNLEELKEYGYISHVSNIHSDVYFLKEFSSLPIRDKQWIENSSLLISSIADALYEVHRQGIIHRDIKPSNILISKKGPKIADFGLVKSLLSNSISTQTDFVGTIKYTAPEIFSKGKHSVQSDIFSLGVVFYEILTLKHPFEEALNESPAYLINQIINSSITPPHILNDAVPKSLSEVIMKMISKEPKKRFKTMKEVSEAIILSKQSQIEKILTEITSVFTVKNELIISETDKELSKEKLEKAMKAYVMIDFSEAISFIYDAIHFNPLNLDAYLLAILISLHTGVFYKKIKEKFYEVKDFVYNDNDESVREKAKIIDLYLSGDRRWMDYAVSWARKYKNIIIYFIVARSRKDLAAQMLKAASEHYPEYSDFSKFLMEIYLGHINIGNLEEVKEDERIGLISRVALIEHFLFNDYNILRLEKEISQALSKYPYHHAFLWYKVYLNIIKQDWDSFLIDINKLISVSSDDIKAIYYYALYLFYSRRGNKDAAEKYFIIAKSLSDTKLKRIDEIENEIKNLDESIFESTINKIGSFSYEVFIKDFINYYLESNLMWFFKVNLKTVALYDDDIYFIYLSSRPSGQVDFIPLGNFYDIKGNILKAKYRQKTSTSYHVEIEETEEIKGMPVIFSGMQNNLLKKDGKNYIIDYSETILVPRISKRIFVLSPLYMLKNITSSHPYVVENKFEHTVVIVDIDTIKNYQKFDLSIKIESEKTI